MIHHLLINNFSHLTHNGIGSDGNIALILVKIELKSENYFLKNFHSYQALHNSQFTHTIIAFFLHHHHCRLRQLV